jgi:non-ribosomal peptide synthetase component E (peptide arylation enzyme)
MPPPSGREVERTAAGVRGPQEGVHSHPGELDAHLLGHGFANWQLPERYGFIKAVPRTSTGKFWKLKLRERFPA